MQQINKYFESALNQLDYLSLVGDKLDADITELRKDKDFNLELGFNKIYFILMIIPSLQREIERKELKDFDVDNLKILDALSEAEKIDFRDLIVKAGFDREIIVEELTQAFSLMRDDIKVNVDTREAETDSELSLYLDFKNFEARQNYMESKKIREKLERQRVTLYETSLLDATNSFEYYISKILEEMIRKNPESLFKSNKEVKMKEVFKYDTFESFKESVIDKYVKDLMYKGRRDWFEEFDKRNKNFKRQYDLHSRQEVEDIFLVRNAIVHNGSAITKECAHIFKERKINEPISLTHKSVREMSEKLLIEGLKIGYYLQMNDRSKSQETMNNFEQGVGLRLIEEGLTKSATQFYGILWEDRELGNQEFKLRISMNYALSLKKEKKDFSFILDNLDMSVVGPEHKLAVSGLNDDIDGVLKYFWETAKQKDSFKYQHLIGWPIISDVIETKEFVEFSKEYFPEDSKFYFPDEENKSEELLNYETNK